MLQKANQRGCAVVIEWSALIGLAALIMGVVGGVIARDRSITNMIRDNHEELTKDITDRESKLHDRINKTRDEMTSRYVRRDDLDGHLERIGKGITELKIEMREERRETNTRLDTVIAALPKSA